MWDCPCSHYWHNCCFHESSVSFIFHNDELAGRTILIQRTILPYWKDAVGLGSFDCYTKSKKTDGNGNRAVDDEPFIGKRKPLSTTAVIGVLSNGPSQKKKGWKWRPSHQRQNFHRQEEAIKYDACKRCFKLWWAYAYSSEFVPPSVIPSVSKG